MHDILSIYLAQTHILFMFISHTTEQQHHFPFTFFLQSYSIFEFNVFDTDKHDFVSFLQS